MKSESSTISDNTAEFIDIVKKYDVVYNTHNSDYKNVEVKMKVWKTIAEEIGLSVDASKRKWKNLRDSYTKYLRSFRIGTKTSKKYQFWAHAEHMDFLKPYQGPGRNSSTNSKANDEDETESDLGLQVLSKTGSASNEDENKTNTNQTIPASTAASFSPTGITASTTITSSTVSPNTAYATSTIATSSSNNSMMLPMPTLPTVALPPQLSGKAILAPMPISTSMPPQIFPLPQITGNNTKTPIPMPASSTASSVGCLIIEPQLFAGADTFKKEFNPSTLGIFHNMTSAASATVPSTKVNPPLITKIRRVQPSPQSTAINLSFSSATATPTQSANSTYNVQQPPPKMRKLSDRAEVDIGAILQANRDLDANTLFFLSLARSVRAMPIKFQSLAKMRCMRIISDIELELDSVDCNGILQTDYGGNSKFCSLDTPPPPDANIPTQNIPISDSTTEHFVYVMSPSRVESLIDISSDEDTPMNGN